MGDDAALPSAATAPLFSLATAAMREAPCPAATNDWVRWRRWFIAAAAADDKPPMPEPLPAAGLDDEAADDDLPLSVWAECDETSSDTPCEARRGKRVDESK